MVVNGVGRGVELICLKRKIQDKNLFFICWWHEWSSRNLWKMMSADVKATIKQQIKDLVAYFTKKYLQNLKYNIKSGCIGWYSIRLGIERYEWGSGFFLLYRKNLLSMMKVTCRQSLKSLCMYKAKLDPKFLLGWIFDKLILLLFQKQKLRNLTGFK